MRHIITATLLTASVLITAPTFARDINVRITNLTNGIYFTPLLVAVHHRDRHLFRAGTEASPKLQAMAEGGTISGLIEDLEASGGVYVENPASGILPPGGSTSARLKVRNHRTTRLSIVAMLLPTNDGFVGLDAAKIPNKKGSYTFNLNGYDAGTEANDEIVNGGGDPGVPGIPADPGGNNGSNATGAAGEDLNNKVHIHRGILGDSNKDQGFSDLDSRIHRWLNPVARVVVSVE